MQGVISGRVVSSGGEIVEIHVLADHTRSPKQVVRDIESAVLVKLGNALDHKRISVAQLGDADKQPAVLGPRLLLQRIDYSTGNGEINVKITVTIEGEPYTATIAGLNAKQHRLRLAAEATLSAVAQYLGASAKFVTIDVQKLVMAGQEAIIVLVSLNYDHAEEELLGAALNKGDDLEATARATLDAVNRRLIVFRSN
ncbi:MAG: hypothetical protein AB1767_11180 [Bacillota bacterium]